MKMAAIRTHKQARDQTYLITWKLGWPLQLLSKPVTVSLPRTQGQVPALGGCILKLTPGFWESQWDPPSRTGGSTLARVFQWKGSLSKGDSCTEGSGQGKEGGHPGRQPSPAMSYNVQQWMLFTRTPDVSETFPSQVYILNVLRSYWREGNKCPHSMEIYFSSNGGLTCDDVITCETVLKKRVRD